MDDPMLRNLERDQGIFKASLQKLSESVSRLALQRAELPREITELKSKINDTQKALATYKNELRHKETLFSKVKQEYLQSDRELSKVEDSISKLEKEIKKSLSEARNSK